MNNNREKRRIQREKKKNMIISDTETTNNQELDLSASLTTTELTFDSEDKKKIRYFGSYSTESYYFRSK